jgi:hypothetical protein
MNITFTTNAAKSGDETILKRAFAFVMSTVRQGVSAVGKGNAASRQVTAFVDGLVERVIKLEEEKAEQARLLEAAELDDRNDQDLMMYFVFLATTMGGFVPVEEARVIKVLLDFLKLNYHALFPDGELNEDFKNANHWLFHLHPSHKKTWDFFIEETKAYVAEKGVPQMIDGADKDGNLGVVVATGNPAVAAAGNPAGAGAVGNP